MLTVHLTLMYLCVAPFTCSLSISRADFDWQWRTLQGFGRGPGPLVPTTYQWHRDRFLHRQNSIQQEIEVSIDVPFWKDANQYQHILNAETASMSVHRYKKLAHRSKCRHFVNHDVTCLDRTIDSEKPGGGEPTIKAVLLHRRQFRWVRSWESACQRWWRFLQPRIWITVAPPCLLRSSTASVREGLRRGQTEKECSEFNDSDHSKRTLTCLECSGMI